MVGSGFCTAGEGKRKRKLKGTGCRKPRPVLSSTQGWPTYSQALSSCNGGNTSSQINFQFSIIYQ